MARRVAHQTTRDAGHFLAMDAPIMLDRDWVLMPDGSEITWEDYYLSTLDDSVRREEDCPGHLFYRDGKWQKCRTCDYMEPIGMIEIPEGD